MEDIDQSKITRIRDPFAALAVVEEDLKRKGITIVELGDILNARFGYPICIQTLKWAIPDSQLSLASNVLLDHNVPRGGLSRDQARMYSEWETVGALHRCGSMLVHLVPLSYTRLSLNDCTEVLSGVSLKQKTLVPRFRPYLISLIRTVMDMPWGIGGQRTLVRIDIAVFIQYVVFPKLLDEEDEESESEDHFQQRVEQALSSVRQWGWKPEEEKYLNIAEKIIRDGNFVNTLGD
ncbi:hypothetical protein PRK78_006698 [Emydomyces testavorans]|uniref:Uncharacterized protein n=1 Tax=Emydomyces testavorans TaxID=2070801 RepID=A0AAF0DMZ3_9EURO|nr:hypothetical protein PRK78_006698 [Emydomyces testavorans]